MYERKNANWASRLDFFVIDILCLQLSLVLTYMFRHGFRLLYGKGPYLEYSIFLLCMHSFVLIFFETFNDVLHRNSLSELKSTLKTALAMMFMSLAFFFFTKQAELYSRLLIFLLPICYTVICFAARMAWKAYLLFICKNQRMKNSRSLMVLATSGDISRIIENIQKDGMIEFTISSICILDRDMTGSMINGVPVVASGEQALEYIKSNVIDEVFISADSEQINRNFLRSLSLMGVTTHVHIAQADNEISDNVVEQWGGYTVLTSSMSIISKKDRILKRILDILGALVGLSITGILSLFFIPIIWIQSPGKIFFTQERVGKGGRKFKIYKFRSMYPDAEERKKELMAQNTIKDGLMFKMDNDPRIFPFGKILRKYSLDEFPQFLNVLRGDMSLVGTRPPTIDEYEKYELHHKSRLAVKPGITGMWQISGRSRIKDFEDVVSLDNQYIRDWSLKLDLKILLSTVRIVLLGEGAM